MSTATTYRIFAPERSVLLTGLMMSLRLIKTTAAVLLLAYLGCAQAATPLTSDIRLLLKDDLYPITSLLPGYRRPDREAIKFAVAEFRVVDDDWRVWSQAIAEVLRYRIQYVPTARLYMPAPYFTHADAGISDFEVRPLLTRAQDFRHLHQALGIETILTGEIESINGETRLQIELVEAGNGAIIAQQDWNVGTAELPQALLQISAWVYQQLGVKLSPQESAYLENSSSLEPDALESFIANYIAFYKLEGPLRRDKIRQLQTKHPEFVLLGVYALHNQGRAGNLDEGYQRLAFNEKLRSLFPGNAGVELESYRNMNIEVLPKHEVAKRLTKMKQLVNRNPLDPTVMINLADMLVKNGSTYDGLAILLEAVDRWPNQYRAWWSLGWALNRHAWQVRGESIWRDVPERAKEEFTQLSNYADAVIDRALTLNPRSASLWSMKINSLGSKHGFTEQIIEVFDRAVKLAPKNRYIYENAMNYSTARWGGNAAARVHIINAAESNYPAAPWLEAMKKRHVNDLDNWHNRLGTSSIEIFIKEVVDHPNGKFIALVVVATILVMVFYLGRKSA